MIVRPNPGANFSAANYEVKAARWKKLWPEITVLPVDVSSQPASWIAKRDPVVDNIVDRSRLALRLAGTTGFITAPRPR